ncbi:succinate dehydrogenase, hydrophobic membrane anchor protein [Erythrobacter sp. NE805]|uniref:succinate dehydrogenase, hydrophobic membrane anchor protein n=1 Tax=Erythrobacter sp. NE805 TaxID=3389875 RepID=UPI00396B3BF0
MGNGTPIGRVRGLGTAHEGAHHWIVHRMTAIGNLVVMSYLIVSLTLLGDYGHASVVKWLASPMAATAIILLVISVFWHARLGLQIVIEDYMTDAGTKLAILAALNIAIIGGGAFAIFSVATLAFGRTA